MAISPYLKDLRKKVGHDLLLVPAVAGVIWDAEGRVLLQRRADDGQWSLPAGSVEPGEIPYEAVIREVWEETGLSVEPYAILGVFGGSAHRVRYLNGDAVEYTTTVFACRLLSGVLQPQDDESADLRYFRPDAMPPLSMPYPPEMFRFPGQSLGPPLFDRLPGRSGPLPPP